MAIYGIARVSTKKQNIERQIRNIHAKYPNANIVKIIYTGAKVIGYKDFIDIVGKAKEGDTIVFDAVTRMSRNSEEGCKMYEELFNRNVRIEFLKEPHINTDVYKKALDNQIKLQIKTGNEATDKLMEGIIKALNEYTLALAKEQIKTAFDQAEKELDNIHKNTKDGIETARANGKQIGIEKGRKLTTKKSIEAKALIMKYSKDYNGQLNDKECMKLIGIAKNTFYKYRRELMEEDFVPLDDDFELLPLPLPSETN